MENIAGPPVKGDNFFGRKDVIEYYQIQLKTCDILLLGARRIGKTSLARAIMVALQKEGWIAVEINVASCESEQAFIEKLENILSEKTMSLTGKIKKGVVKQFLDIKNRIKKVKAGGVEVSLDKEAEDWAKLACDILKLIAQNKQHWLIYMDELPIMLYNIIRNDPQNGIQRVRRFLDWFRNDIRDFAGADNIRWLVSGSVGLDTLVQEHGMADTINSFSHEGLEPFSEEEAFQMLDKLANSYNLKFSDQDKNSIISAVQWSQPYYLQLIFNHIRTIMISDKTGDISSLIQKALNKMIEPGVDNDFHHWEIRLGLQLNRKDADHALALLNHSAHNPSGERPEVLLSRLHERMSNNTAEEAKKTFIHLRDILLRDAYWQANETGDDKRYQFRLEPLRLWWLRRNKL